MFRILIIFSLIAYVVYKIGSLFFRAGAASSQHLRDQQRKNFDNNIDAESGKTKKSNKGNSKSGEYIDYEEVK